MKQKMLCLVIASLIFFCGCTQLTGSKTSNSNDSYSPEYKMVLENTDKYNAYLDFFNHASDLWFFTVIESYFDYFGSEKELIKSSDFPGYFDETASMLEGQLDYSEKARTYIEQKPDYENIDTSMEDLCDSYESLVNTFFYDANNYYFEKEFLKDNYQQGQVIHENMISQYDDLYEKLVQFETEFSTIIYEVEGAELPVLDESGFVIHSSTLRLVLTAKRINTLFQRMGDTSFLEMDLEIFKPLYDLFMNQLEILEDNYRDTAQLKKENLETQSILILEAFVFEANSMKKCLIDTYTMIEANSTNIETVSDHAAGSFEKFADLLISQYNRLI